MASSDPLDAVPLGAATAMLVVDASGRPLRANRAFAVLAGRTTAEIATLGLADILESDDAAMLVAVLAHLVGDDVDSGELEFRMIGAGGSRFWVAVHPVVLDDGGVAAPPCMLLMRKAGAIEPVLAMHYDAAARLVYANRGARERLGMPLATLIGRRPEALSGVMACAAAHARLIDLVLATGESLDLGRVTKASWPGEDRVTHGRVSPQRDRSGRVAGAVCLAHRLPSPDESERRLLRLLEHAPDIIARFDLAGRCLDVNPAIERTGGVSASRFIGCRLDEVVAGLVPNAVAATDAMLEMIRDVAASGAPREVEFILPLAAGQRHLDIRLVPETDAAGDPAGVLCYARDVTELKRAERRLRRSREQLRKLVARQETLREQERTRIAREMHDELGQLLTGIRAGVSGLARDAGGDESAFRQRIAELTKLVDETMAVVRDVAASLRPAALDMGIVAALEWLAGEFSRYTGIACRLHAGIDGIRPRPDAATMLFRVAQESLTNVARHARAKRVDIELSRVGSDLVLRVRDDGRGFVAGKAVGQGLGLVGMRERVSILGGELAILGVPGSGTTIVVSIPVQAVEGAE